MEADVVVIALGTNPNPLVPRTTYGLDIDRHGCIVADPQTGATSREGVYAGGDIVTGAATVILAMGAGRRAATAMHEYLQQRAAATAEAEQASEEYQRGRGDGIVWASDYATADELRNLVENFETARGGDFDDPHWRGFVSGAEEILGDVGASGT
jgi:NADH dehydrogenase FAD-containing subunit